MSAVALAARQAGFDVRLLLRNGEQLLLTLVIPVVLLLVLTASDVVSLGQPPGVPRIDAALAGVLAVAVLSSAFTSLAIATGFDRRSGAFLLLATTPLTRATILAARSMATLLVVALQVGLLFMVAAALGWRPDLGDVAATLILVLVGALSLGALGFALGGALRAEATLAVANAVFLILLVAGGSALPTSSLPGPLASVVAWLPSALLGDALRHCLASEAAQGPLALAVTLLALAAWMAVGVLVARRTFRWE